jgi:XRE family aerobic/anaerobic benzoate catabolism transcriptional regulator
MSRVREQGHLPTTGDHASAMQELRAVLASREPLYARAAAQVDTSDIPVPAMLDRLTATIETRFGLAPTG